MDGPTHEEKRRIFEQPLPARKQLSPREIDTCSSYSRVERYPAGREIYAKGSPGKA